MIARAPLDLNTKTILQFLKIMMYFFVYTNFIACMWWSTVIETGAPVRYGKDLEHDGYMNSKHELFLDESG